MGNWWEIVLTSSAVSAVGSALIGEGFRRRSARRAENAVAQIVARALEAYTRLCADAIAETDIAIEELYEGRGGPSLARLTFPQFQAITMELDALEPMWRDEISGFPAVTAAIDRKTHQAWKDTDDEHDFMHLLQEYQAEAGQAAFDLAKRLRVAHELPLEYAQTECQDALVVLTATAEQKARREARQEAEGVALNAELAKLLPLAVPSNPAE